MIKKDWVELPPHSQGYKDGVNYFLDIAFTKGKVEEEEILCPCAVCCNDSWEVRDVVYDHLCSKGFVKGYTEWIYHGEDESLMDLDGDSNDETSSHDDIDGLLFETFKDAAEGGGVHEGLNEDAKKFYKLVDDANQELYPGCEKFSSLSFTIRIYLLKCLHGWSNASFTALLELLKEAMPDLNIPVSFNKTKSMIKDLGLDYKKIDACPNNCMLFWKDHGKDDSCHICGASRWIEYPEVANDLEESIKAHKVPAKVLRHFPLIPRLKRLFMCSKTADTLRWHAEHRSRDGKLRHPADAQAWKDFDAKHSDFACETRNIRLGLQGINEDVENDDINDEIQEDDVDSEIQVDDVDDEFQEDGVGDEFQEDDTNLDDEFQEDDIDLDDEFQEDDIDGEFQEEDVDEEFLEEDMCDEFQKDDVGDEFEEEKLK
ncbi:uncharacterized protein LOC131642695 [Vicia villosa]|uniref:uncharacterized protein LOC131642695 n=1 Tax=Vicia villosa TaxID=3911 RepID=UPI00273AF7EB|nr:uncharacterized protein LOC131642695 [Vicia villosa]